ncbi:general substrate transporter [Pyrenochaeta sp. MPI-SDFR-AT-0127]|nr:general substrate transporter [Pyrenochaeta sp. MPI-SDFR-AT-0127]
MGIAKANVRSNGVNDELSAVLPDSRPWYTKAHLIKLHFCIGSLMLFSSANGYDGSLMNGLQALQQWEAFMEKPTGSWLGFINAIYWLGMGISYPLTAFVANKYGRKVGVYVGYIFLVAGSLVVISDNNVSFIISRFLVGCASAWFGNAVPLLINEISHPSYRGIVSALFMCGWYVGGTIAAFVTFGTRNVPSDWAWRIPSILQLLLPILALPGLLMAPESPRWLVSIDRVDQARGILITSHAGGDPSSALVEYEMIEITAAIKLESTLADASYMELCKTPGNRRRLLISVSLGIFSQWCGNGVVSYYLAIVLRTVGITSVTHQTLIAGLLQVWNLIFASAAALSVDRLGRRPLFLASTSIMLVGYILVTALSGSFAETGSPATGVAVIPFLFIFFAGYDIALTPFLTAYPCEIWPYRLRSHGLTITWITVVVANFFNTFVNPIALESIGWKYYFVFVVVLVVMGFTVYFFYPETKGHTLEHMAVLFDGEDAAPSSAETAQRANSVTEKGEYLSTLHDEKV